VGINNKLRDLVERSYDMNRSAFYAYGGYLNNFRTNLLKFIFKTEAIDVAALSKSYGFAVPPRVKDGRFLKV
jgi:ATP-dependent RNA helicase DDX18/HAS1